MASVLFLLHLPPPVHGSAVMGGNIKNSTLLNQRFNCDYLNINTSVDIENIGKVSLKKIIQYFEIIRKLLFLLFKKNFDLIYLAINAGGYGFIKDFIFVLFAKFFRKKIIIHYHNKGVSKYGEKLFFHILYKWMFRDVKVILLSEMLYRDVSKYITEDQVYYCPNGIVDANEHYIARKNFSKVPKILFVSNLIESKGIWIVLEIMSTLINQGYEFTLSIIGKEGDVSEDELLQEIKRLDLQDHVQVRGPLYGDEKYIEFKESDIFLFPTYYENETFGLVNVEAMMFGLPVVTSDVGGLPDVVRNNYNGFTVESKNIEEFTSKVSFLLKSPEIAIALGDNGRKRFVENFTLSVFERRVIDILRDAMDYSEETRFL